MPNQTPDEAFDEAFSDGSRVAGPRSALSAPRFEVIWVQAAAQLGWTVSRTEICYASSDGRGAIAIGVDAILDADDSAAQLIFHELCHGLVEGPTGRSLPDWGLSNCDSQHVEREHACLHLQIALCEPFGLRHVMAPTTEYRGYHDAVDGDPLGSLDRGAGAIARIALARPESRQWRHVLEAALRATRSALDTPAAIAAGDPVGGPVSAPVTGRVDAPERAERHPTGLPTGDGRHTCGGCAWIHVGGRGRGVHRCRQAAVGDAAGARTEPHHLACALWEPPVACQDCGACCREAYHSVTVAVRDPVVWKRPEYVVRTGHRFEIRRADERCAALEDRRRLPVFEAAPRPTFACQIYEDRPRPCREFEAGGRHCLVARRRVGLSRRDDRR